MRTSALAIALMLASAQAHAEEPIDKDLVETKIAEKADKAGWFPSLDIGAMFQLGHSHQVVGQTDGVTIAMGAAIGAGLVMEKGNHEWSTSLGWKFALMRSPDLKEFSKGQDDVFFQTRYLYSFPKPKWLGVFGKFRLETAFLPGWKVSLGDADVRVEDWEGGELAGEGYSVGPGEKINLTESFSPLLLKENVGLMATPVDKKPIKWEISAGIGAHEFFAFDGLRFADSDTTPELDLQLMRDYVQVGAALETRIIGEPHAFFMYAAGVELMQPFYTSIDTNLKGIEFLNVRIDALMRFKLWKFLTLDISLDVKHYPVVSEQWQVSTNLLINFHFAYPAPVEPPPCPPCPACPVCPEVPVCETCAEPPPCPDCPDCPDCPPTG